MIYRRHYQEVVWHFCQNCASWPTERFEERSIEPAREVLCSMCTRRAKELTCEVMPEPGVS